MNKVVLSSESLLEAAALPSLSIEFFFDAFVYLLIIIVPVALSHLHIIFSVNKFIASRLP